MSRSRNWCFTLVNYTEEEVNHLKGELPQVRYIVFQREIGENGTRHLQGYLEFEIPERMSFLKRINARAHWEPRLGSQREAINYCTRENTREPGTEPFEQGNKANPTGIHKYK